MTAKTKYTYIPYIPDNSGIFYPEMPDELPDAMYQFPRMTHTMDILLWRYGDRHDVLVSGNNAIYYRQGNPRVHRSPDGFIAFGVDRNAILGGKRLQGVGSRASRPDWVLEIASPSTARVDLGIKREIYASIGIGEYWRFDASGGRYYGEPLVGEFLQDGQYRRFDIHTSEDGVAWGHSPRCSTWTFIGETYGCITSTRGRRVAAWPEGSAGRTAKKANLQGAGQPRESRELEERELRARREGRVASLGHAMPRCTENLPTRSPLADDMKTFRLEDDPPC